jgi:hypothetical protein
MDKNNLSADEAKLNSYLMGTAKKAIQHFCKELIHLPKHQYPEALLGMGYQYESFDHMFALIACNVQATVDHSDYVVRYQTMQSVLQPFASEYAIEPERKLGNPHRKLFADFYQKATGKDYPSYYPAVDNRPWLSCGKKWAHVMIHRLEAKHLNLMDRAKYNVGYHWSVEYLSINEFDQLKNAWAQLNVRAPYMQAHCDVEENHAGCATMAVKYFCSLEDPLVRQGILDHEADLVGFYNECSDLILSEVPQNYIAA